MRDQRQLVHKGECWVTEWSNFTTYRKVVLI